jgi:hypothetical protein
VPHVTPPQSHIWSKEQERVVVAMLIEGMSASGIASVFQISRNAAIGRIARNPDLHKYVRTKPRKAPRVPKKIFKENKRMEPVQSAEPKPAPMRPMPLIDTGSSHCKWPIADDDSVLGGILCCGRPVGFEMVYCEPHHRAAHPRRAE